MQTSKTIDKPTMQKAPAVVEIRNLKKSFGKKEVLTDINMDLYKGENLVVLGRSGQGKSVTIKCIVALLQQDKGSLKVFGDEVSEMKHNELKA
jgi:phospholipid/cholesterol/gamma-HCH transport system ATP-binding protein